MQAVHFHAYVYIVLGANINVKDRCGCNFLHLAILQPKGLKNLPQEVLQVTVNQRSLFVAYQIHWMLLRQSRNWNLIAVLSLINLPRALAACIQGQLMRFITLSLSQMIVP